MINLVSLRWIILAALFTGCAMEVTDEPQEEPAPVGSDEGEQECKFSERQFCKSTGLFMCPPLPDDCVPICPVGGCPRGFVCRCMGPDDEPEYCGCVTT